MSPASELAHEPRGAWAGMSGHSKWATTKHKKAVVDAKRGKLFAKLIKNIEVAARTGGGDPDGNPTLYDAIQKARKTSVPTDNIERAVKRGSGADAGGADYQTIMYEGYGPGGVALLIEPVGVDQARRVVAGVFEDGAEEAFVHELVFSGERKSRPVTSACNRTLTGC